MIAQGSSLRSGHHRKKIPGSMRLTIGKYLKRIGGQIFLGLGMAQLVWGGQVEGGAKVQQVTLEEREQQAHGAAEIYAMGVGPPLGRLLLMRRGTDLCAVRFTEFHRGQDGTPPSLFHSGDEEFYAKYHWYYPENEVGSFTGDEVDSGHRELDRQPLVGLMFGRLGFQLGTTKVNCGPFHTNWYYPTMVSFDVIVEEGSIDSGIELAPTKWSTLSEINLKDPALIWYGYNEKQPNIFIPLEDLPGEDSP